MMTGNLTMVAARLERAAAEFGAAYQELRTLARDGLRELYNAHGVDAPNRIAGVTASFDHLELEAAGALAAAGAAPLFESGVRSPDLVSDFSDRWQRRERDLLERIRRPNLPSTPYREHGDTKTSATGTPLSAANDPSKLET